jgi:voltage-gated potassium channel
MVAAIIEGDLTELYGARRMRMSIDRLKNHYIICGYGRVGVEVAQELRRRNEPFVVVDHLEEALGRARADGVLWLAGDATTEGALKAAGIERCHALVAASDSDSGNVYITLTAKALRPEVFVVARVGTPGVSTKLKQAGADRIISPYSLGGRHMALAALQPIISDFMDLMADGTHGDRILAEVNVDPVSGLAGRTLSDALARCHDVVALALTDPEGKLTVGPAASTVLQTGDRLTLVGTQEDLLTVGGVKR